MAAGANAAELNINGVSNHVATGEQVSDNNQIMPSVFWMPRSLGHYTANLSGYKDQDGASTFGIFGGLIQSVFRF